MFSFGPALSFIDEVISNGLFLPQGRRQSYRPPEILQGYSPELLQDDLNYLIARWFIDSLRSNYIPADDPYPYIHEAVKCLLSKKFPNLSESELNQNTDALSSIIFKLEETKSIGRKTYFSVDERSKLLFKSKGRCQICGFVFPDEVVERFVSRDTSISFPEFESFDFLKPTKSSRWNFQIEVDHIYPIARGGTNDLDNLQLLCGFCNSAKKHFITIFDPSDKIREFLHPRLGKIKLSNPFLVVRVLVGNQCYSCKRNATQTELTVTPLYFYQKEDTKPTSTPSELIGEINPVNIHATCYGCDPIKSYRYVLTST